MKYKCKCGAELFTFSDYPQRYARTLEDMERVINKSQMPEHDVIYVGARGAIYLTKRGICKAPPKSKTRPCSHPLAALVERTGLVPDTHARWLLCTQCHILVKRLSDALPEGVAYYRDNKGRIRRWEGGSYD